MLEIRQKFKNIHHETKLHHSYKKKAWYDTFYNFLINGFLWNALSEIPFYLSWEVVNDASRQREALYFLKFL